MPQNWIFDVFITDDNSSDGTVEEVLFLFPNINIEVSKNNLYWARGMNTSWNIALNKGNYNAFLLINDDVTLDISFWNNIFITHQYCILNNNCEGIYVSSTIDKLSRKLSYGGKKLLKNYFRFQLIEIKPLKSVPIKCDVANANILFIPMSIVNLLGIFDNKYIHGIADYDYTLTANAKKIPIYVTPNYGGYCTNDHGNNWLNSSFSLKERVKYLYSPKGLSYKEYCYYLFKHFPFYAPYGILMLWIKTLFPFLWDRLK